MNNVYTLDADFKRGKIEISPEGLRRITLRAPMPPTLSNSGKGRSRHWRTLERERENYQSWLTNLVYARMIPKPPAEPLERAIISSRMRLGAAMDDDNASIRHKWLLDWLVRGEYLKSDRRTHLRWRAFPEQEVRRDGDYYIDLTIEEVRDFSSLEVTR